MKRLTEKYIDRDNKTQYQNACGINEFEYCGGREDIFNKLGKLEDIEEELGIDLITLFKALKNGVYVRYTNNEIEHRIVAGIEEENITLCIKENKECYMYFDEYGKTWALTKEELL